MAFFITLFGTLSVFGIGVTIIDLLGLIGHGHDDQGDDSHTGDHGDHGHEDGVHGHDDNFDDHHSGTHLAFDHGKEPEPVTTHETTHADVKNQPGQVEVPEKIVKNPVEKLLFALRSFVYFSLGFGPTGFFVLFTTRHLWLALPLALLAGAASFMLAYLVRRIQSKTLDSQLSRKDLIMAEGTVLIKIEKGLMGKVRVKMDGYFTDRIAKAEYPNEVIPANTKVRIVRVTDDIIYVTAEKNILER